jgi:hypothetical protein
VAIIDPQRGTTTRPPRPQASPGQAPDLLGRILRRAARAGDGKVRAWLLGLADGERADGAKNDSGPS